MPEGRHDYHFVVYKIHDLEKRVSLRCRWCEFTLEASDPDMYNNLKCARLMGKMHVGGELEEV